MMEGPAVLLVALLGLQVTPVFDAPWLVSANKVGSTAHVIVTVLWCQSWAGGADAKHVALAA